MRQFRNTLLVLLLFTLGAGATTLTGTFRQTNANRVNGKLRLSLT